MTAMTELLSWMKKRSSASNELARKAEAELSALREAGKAMAQMLKYVNDKNKEKENDDDDTWLWSQNSDTGKNILAALEAWEAANK